MLWFPQPACPRKAGQRSDTWQQVRGPLHLLGPHRELAFRTFCELLQLEVQNFVAWAGEEAPTSAKAVLQLQLVTDLPDLPAEVDLTKPESYYLEVQFEDIVRIRILAGDRAGLKYGVVALAGNFCRREQIRTGWEYGCPDFPVRGIVEGFYGTPWTHQERLGMLAFLERYRFNTYFYAPKDDFYHREKWREPYPEAEGARLRELVAEAEKRGITWIYGIGPGLTLEFSNAADCQLVLDKVQSVMDMGVQQFALLLDDIPETMVYASDRQQFSSVAQSHIHLAHLLWDHLQRHGEDPVLYICPTEYCQDMEANVDPGYLPQLGAGLHPEIRILWTGPAICSQTIDIGDVHFVQERLQRSPVYWDNYPVNDCAMYRNLHIGSYCGRSGELVGNTAGFLANPMPLPEASKLALATMADYLWDALNYKPDAAWLYALQQAAGLPAAMDLQVLGDVCQLSPLRPSPEQPLAELAPGARLACARRVQEAAGHLAAFCGNEALLRDIRPWLHDLQHWGRVVQALEEGRLEDALALVAWANPDVETIGPTVRSLYKTELAGGSL